jgi:hypothetical protein
MMVPICELPHEVVEAWLAKLLPEVSDCDNYFQEHSSINVGQTHCLGRETSDLGIWKRDGKYELFAIWYVQSYDVKLKFGCFWLVLRDSKRILAGVRAETKHRYILERFLERGGVGSVFYWRQVLKIKRAVF